MSFINGTNDNERHHRNVGDDNNTDDVSHYYHNEVTPLVGTEMTTLIDDSIVRLKQQQNYSLSNQFNNQSKNNNNSNYQCQKQFHYPLEQFFCCNVSQRWFPSKFEGDYEDDVNQQLKQQSLKQKQQHQQRNQRQQRTFKRRIFLFMTEPNTSIGSAIFFSFIILTITLSNIIMIMQTMDTWQYSPSDCISCGGNIVYEGEEITGTMMNNDDFIRQASCVCPPIPLPRTNRFLDWTMYILTAEWIVRVLVHCSPVSRTLAADTTITTTTTTTAMPDPMSSNVNFYFLFFFLSKDCQNWFHNVITDWSIIVDALAIFPYYLKHLPNGFVSLRLLRLVRIFSLVRLGQYNSMVKSLTNVLQKSTSYLRLLILVLAFGAAIFGSMVYWLERGNWKYHNGIYQFVRIGIDGRTEEPSPFTSIPAASWWFFVTATTVGYGDYYPTSTAGKWCATLAMLTGVLVIAFPVSVFSDLWHEELKTMKEFGDQQLHGSQQCTSIDNDINNSNNQSNQINSKKESNEYLSTLPSTLSLDEGEGTRSNRNYHRHPSDIYSINNNHLSPSHATATATTTTTTATTITTSTSTNSVNTDEVFSSQWEDNSPRHDILTTTDTCAGTGTTTSNRNDTYEKIQNNSQLLYNQYEHENENEKDDIVMIYRQDWKEIEQCLDTIRINELRIRSILSKYPQ